MERTRVHAAPRTAAVWAVLRAELERRPGERLVVVDVGGGTGGFAVPLAEDGHHVTVVDASPDALAALTRRAADAGVAERVRAVQGDAAQLAELVPASSVDLVLCHSLLEVVDSPTEVAGALAGVLRPGGAASVLVANRAAAVLGRALGGRFANALELLDEHPAPSQPPSDPAPSDPPPSDPPPRRYDLDSIAALLGSAGMVVEEVHGVRVVADLIPGGLLDASPGASEALVRFELAVAGRSPYRDVATQLHVLARQTGGSQGAARRDSSDQRDSGSRP